MGPCKAFLFVQMLLFSLSPAELGAEGEATDMEMHESVASDIKFELLLNSSACFFIICASFMVYLSL
jgi:hypothetical protein